MLDENIRKMLATPYRLFHSHLKENELHYTVHVFIGKMFSNLSENCLFKRVMIVDFCVRTANSISIKTRFALKTLYSFALLCCRRLPKRLSVGDVEDKMAVHLRDRLHTGLDSSSCPVDKVCVALVVTSRSV